MTILAGGVGSRFWPVSTPDRPKQLLPLASERPLIVDTMERASAITDTDRIRILAGSHLVEPMRRALPELPESIFLVEPRARGTAPVLVWAAWTLLQKDPDAILVSLHSDHVVDPPDAFVATVLRAARVARDHRRLMTVAIPPDRPEVGYGYIQPGDEIGEGFDVVAFHEKPDRETAARYVDDGYLWNSGIFVWRARDFLDEVRAHAPEIGDLLVHLDEGEPEKFFQEAPKISVDEAVLERSSRVAAVKADFRWDDVGSWEALARNRSPGPDGNVVQGRARFVDSRDNIVYSEEKPVVLFGVDDLVVVRTGDVTLVTRRDRAPRLKELLDELPEELRNP